MTNIVIVEDKTGIRNIIYERLNNFSDINILFTAHNGAEFIELMSKQKQIPDVVLMDIDMPVMNGIEAVARAKHLYPSVQFIMLTIFDEDDKIFNAIKAGAGGYLLKDESTHRIKEAIEDLMQNKGAPVSPGIARRMLHLLTQVKEMPIVETNTKEEYNLTAREKEVLELLITGYSHTKIATILFVSPNTIRNHISNIYKKLHVTSKIQAIQVYNRI